MSNIYNLYCTTKKLTINIWHILITNPFYDTNKDNVKHNEQK